MFFFFFWKTDNGHYYFRWPRVAYSSDFPKPNLTRGHAPARQGLRGVFSVVRTEIRHGRSMRLVVGPFLPARRDNCLRGALETSRINHVLLLHLPHTRIRVSKYTCVHGRSSTVSMTYRTRHIVRNPNQIIAAASRLAITAASVPTNKSFTIDTLTL